MTERVVARSAPSSAAMFADETSIETAMCLSSTVASDAENANINVSYLAMLFEISVDLITSFFKK
jgi:hypothetical protein